MFGRIMSNPIVTKKIDIIHGTVKAADGYIIPIHIYKPETVKENAPILYYIHGGGFFGGPLDNFALHISMKSSLSFRKR